MNVFGRNVLRYIKRKEAGLRNGCSRQIKGMTWSSDVFEEKWATEKGPPLLIGGGWVGGRGVWDMREIKVITWCVCSHFPGVSASK